MDAHTQHSQTSLPEPNQLPSSTRKPLVSVIVMNYNGAPWLKPCLQSLREQTLFEQIEVIVADNASPDRSELMAAQLMAGWPRASTLAFLTNVGYAAGNNRAAVRATGEYLFFLNNDIWLEADCLAKLVEQLRASKAQVAAPLVLEYGESAVQSAGENGFDIFGLMSGPADWQAAHEIFIASGPALLIEAEWFRKLGGFDDEFFMYAEEFDLCWRLWLAGGRAVLAPDARLHHRGAAAVNPNGGTRMVELRTSDAKRFYANRNCLLVLLKNCQHLLLLMVPLQLALMASEALVTFVLARRWTHLRRAYIDAVRDCWRLRRHILAERRELRNLRKHGDFWMLRFFRLRLNRWRELKRFLRFGLPKMDP